MGWHWTMDHLDPAQTNELEQHPDVIQLITWNDYGEGTIIKPTEEVGC